MEKQTHKPICPSGSKLLKATSSKTLIVITIFAFVAYFVIYSEWINTVNPFSFLERTSQRFEPIDFNQLISHRTGAPVNGIEHEKWIVLTSIFQPTKEVKYLASLEGWKVVVVGDKKSPKDWNFTNCMFLDVETQVTLLGFKLSSKLPYNSYARKNIGYLYAISQGAKVIYETDDDNRPEKNLDSFHLKPTTPGLLYAGHGAVFNPYKHFGQSSIWPRGYPLSAIGEPQDTIYRVASSWPTPVIQQGLVNGDPDVDAIFRLTRKWTNRRLDVKFDPAAPPVFLPSGVFCPFNSQNTLFHHKAFWALYLPTTTTFRMCDIWRSYWAQRLLWEIGGRIGFYPANAYQKRSAHNYMRDATDEKKMYYDTKRLLEFLENWRCETSFSFFNCIIKLTKDMAEHGFWEKNEIFMVKTWLEDLVNIGYMEPERMPSFYEESSNSSGIFPNVRYTKYVKDSCGEMSGENYVQFLGVQQAAPITTDIKRKSLTTSLKHYLSFSSVCPNFSVEFPHHKSVQHFEDILLIVVFNHPLYRYVDIIDALYRPLFPNIVFCGDDASDFRKNGHTLKSFIHVPLFRGHFAYMCATTAMEMGYNVSGYLTVSDDNIVNIWNYLSFRKDRIWMNFDKFFRNFTSKAKDSWWKNYSSALKKTVHEIYEYHGNIPEQVVNISTFKSTYSKNSNGDVVHSVSDIYYVPKRLEESFQFYIHFFCKNRVFLEYAIPFVFRGLSNVKQNVEFLKGKNLYGKNRKVDVLKFFDPNKHQLHPLKLSNPQNRKTMCSRFAKTLLSKLYS